MGWILMVPAGRSAHFNNFSFTACPQTRYPKTNKIQSGLRDSVVGGNVEVISEGHMTEAKIFCLVGRPEFGELIREAIASVRATREPVEFPFHLACWHGCDSLLSGVHEASSAIDGIRVRLIPHVPEDSPEASLPMKVKQISAHLCDRAGSIQVLG